MSSLERDLSYLESIVEGDKNIYNDTFCKMYPLTNDSINTISNILTKSFNCEDIFTVMSSGDFIFTAMMSDVGRIDAFDINPLTYRYFYLRKWLLENGMLEAVNIDLSLIRKIVSKKMDVSDKDEQESAILWSKYLDKLKEMGENNFYDTKAFSVVKRIVLPYKDKLDLVTSELNSRKVNFYTGNICSESFEGPDRQYDFIYLSNILDYNRKIDRLEVASKNIDKLLNENGVVMCTTMFNHLGLERLEIPFFRQNYEFSRIPEANGTTRTYVYQKKQELL